ncbi:hypothetical protein CHLRE_03g174750v5 [Chlamydomonas reinhardtii]|uniref:Uncharacterized protein n=1 Tax=Chlamydomonas reinhardtii TaxID=3055 RepID=A8IE53_CHLRE|nr:uncharacterized protein CHLRE_03g174750v5 [Chlamydomonas reinhardtii]PNW85174.1 hypothetical protein CHLRE_03g174750v5 [Chlamydomonas reinhardtii]|eukprot:XP_001703283.1 peptidyl-prolyl cis-trans isomerase, cyclophilin-type [Chlamydomonas reinhardtii]
MAHAVHTKSYSRHVGSANGIAAPRAVTQAPASRRRVAAVFAAAAAGGTARPRPEAPRPPPTANMDRRGVISALLASALLLPSAAVQAEEVVGSVGSKVFFDLTINGEPAGRITVELLADAPAGASRFASLAAGRQGVDYRLSKFNGVLPTYIRNDGVKSLSYTANEVSPISGVDTIDELEAELDKQTRKHDQAGLVSIVVREKEERPVKERLVARDGKLITVLEQAGEAPNGTQFAITTAPSPDLDGTNLIIGRVVEGGELLERIAKLPVNRPRNDNPYFQAGKAMGDKRAVTAERAFYRPFQKVVVAGSGVL